MLSSEYIFYFKWWDYIYIKKEIFSNLDNNIEDVYNDRVHYQVSSYIHHQYFYLVIKSGNSFKNLRSSSDLMKYIIRWRLERTCVSKDVWAKILFLRSKVSNKLILPDNHSWARFNCNLNLLCLFFWPCFFIHSSVFLGWFKCCSDSQEFILYLFFHLCVPMLFFWISITYSLCISISFLSFRCNNCKNLFPTSTSQSCSMYICNCSIFISWKKEHCLIKMII